MNNIIREMNTKQFARRAIENGHGSGSGGSYCAGWDWIRENISELDYIFYTEIYRKQDGMKSLCMPFLLKDDIFTDEEKEALGTTWYLNNKREYKKRDELKAKTLLDNGWLLLTAEIVKEAIKQGKKLIVKQAGENVFGGAIEREKKLKPFVDHEGGAYVMALNARRRGWRVEGRNWHCKLV